MSLEGAVASDAARAWPAGCKPIRSQRPSGTRIPKVKISTKKSARTVAGASAVDIVLSLADDGQGKTQNPLKTPSVATLLSGANYNVFGLFEPCAGYCAFTLLPAGWRCMNAQEVIV